MKFVKPMTREKTLLEELCEKYNAKLNITEERILNNMSAPEITVVLQYEIKKARIVVRDRVCRIMDRIRKLEVELKEVDGKFGRDELCMKLNSDISHLRHERDMCDEQYAYLGMLGR